MPDYSKAKIYRIVSNVCDLVYYGSSCETLSKRLAQHRRSYNSYLKGKGNYTASFEIIEKGNYEIILVENCPCNSKEELKSRERFYIENNNCVNKYIPGRTLEETREKVKEYYQENREKILKQKSEKICCEICGSKIRKPDIKRHQRTLKCLNPSIK
jgi:hypothetical protein